MKIKDSILNRRKFLNSLLGGWILTFFATILYPIVKFIFPPYREPEKVVLNFEKFKDIKTYEARSFSWGSKPGILLKKENELIAFVGVCTHFDCNVTWIPEERKFYCPCHQGWYDENGINIAGPPPRPLRKLLIEIEGENLIIRKGEKA